MTAAPRSEPPTAVPLAKCRAQDGMVAGGGHSLGRLSDLLCRREVLAFGARCGGKPVAAAVPATVPATPTIPEKSGRVLRLSTLSEKKDQSIFLMMSD